jgi:hypothetical protein
VLATTQKTSAASSYWVANVERQGVVPFGKRMICATKIAMEVCKKAILKMDNAGPAAY